MTPLIRRIFPVLSIMLVLEIGIVVYLHTHCESSILLLSILAFLPFVYIGLVIKRFSKKSFFYSMTVALLLSMAVIVPASILAPVLMEMDCEPGAQLEAYGFKELELRRPTASYETNGSFKAIFYNNAGTQIKIIKVSINETRKGAEPCTNVVVDGGTLEDKIGPSDEFTLTAQCPAKGYGKPYYKVEVNIVYTTAADGFMEKHIENGTVAGLVGL